MLAHFNPLSSLSSVPYVVVFSVLFELVSAVLPFTCTAKMAKTGTFAEILVKCTVPATLNYMNQ